MEKVNTKENVNVKPQPQFTMDKAILPIEWQNDDSKEGLKEYFSYLESDWENECPVSKKYLDLKTVTIFSTNDEGYYRFYFKNKPDKNINDIITIPNRRGWKLIPEIYQELERLFDCDGAPIEPNHWWVCRDLTENQLRISILMPWSN